MSTSGDTNNPTLREQWGNHRIHVRKLQEIKDELRRLCTRTLTKEEIDKNIRQDRRWEEVMKDDLDPFSYCFESGSDDDADSPSLVVSILKSCNLYSEVTNKLNSETGRFTEREAFGHMEKLTNYLLDEFQETRKPIPTKDTYVITDYCLDGNDLVFEPMEELDVASEKRWALGIIYYYLVTGYPALNEDREIKFYNDIGLGPRINTPARNNLLKIGHSFPSRKWLQLSNNTRNCIKGLTSYHPGNRTLTDDLNFEILPWYFDEDYGLKDYGEETKSIHNHSDRSINGTALKAIDDVKTSETNNLRVQKSNSCNEIRRRHKEKWSSFFTEAKKQSRKKKRLINSLINKEEREEKDNSERKINQWLTLYYKRLDSDDAYEEYNTTAVPKGAWGRVE